MAAPTPGETRVKLLLGFVLSFTALATGIMAARLLCARFVHKRPLGYDDWLMMLATVTLLYLSTRRLS